MSRRLWLRDQSPPTGTFMADMKFSCDRCGQHISCDEQWSGHQIQCPACQASLVVPRLQPSPLVAAPAPKPPATQPPMPNRPKLSAGATQVTRPAPPGPTPPRQRVPRPPKTENPILKFAVIVLLLAVIGWAALNYLPSLLTRTQDVGASKPAAPANAPAGGARGPLGEVDAAMDVSDTLDGGSSSRPRAAPARQPVAPQAPATPAPARQPVVNRAPATPATNSAAQLPRRRPR